MQSSGGEAFPRRFLFAFACLILNQISVSVQG